MLYIKNQVKGKSSGHLEIKTKKIVIKGEKKRKIVDIRGLMDNNKLPVSYTSSRPYITKYGNNEIRLVDTGGYVCCIKPGDVMSEERFQEHLEMIKEAGKRLHKARQREKELKREWNGEEVFII